MVYILFDTSHHSMNVHFSLKLKLEITKSPEKIWALNVVIFSCFWGSFPEKLSNLHVVKVIKLLLCDKESMLFKTTRHQGSVMSDSNLKLSFWGVLCTINKSHKALKYVNKFRHYFLITCYLIALNYAKHNISCLEITRSEPCLKLRILI